MKNRKFIVREECFGFTFYDRNILRHKFVLKKDFKSFLQDLQITRQNYDFLPAKEKNLRHDLIYSPIRIYYELTLACNLRCKYCFNSSGNKRPVELTTEEVIKSLYGLKEANVMDIRFTGGEPLCRPDWYKIF